MTEPTPPVHLSHVPTMWSDVLDARDEQKARTGDARGRLLVRYHEAVYRFLLRKLNDPHAAGEVYSNFAERVLEDERLLGKVDPTRGRFRDYLKVVLHRMTVDYWRKAKNSPAPIVEEPPERGAPPEPLDPQPLPLDIWRQELLNQTWKALEREEQKTGQPYATAVRLKEERPDIRARQIAEQLSARFGRPFTEVGVRKLIQRGRELFADLLVAEVARTLQEREDDVVTPQRIQDELIELELLFSYCRAALDRLEGKG